MTSQDPNAKTKSSYFSGRKPSKSPEFAFFATCAKGLEGILEEELQSLGADKTKQTVAGVYFGDLSEQETLTLAYRACLWSRLANKVLLPLASLDVSDAESMYQDARAVAWEEYLDSDGTLLVDFVGTDNVIKNSQFGALKIKDAVVDRLRDLTGSRPSVSKQQPDLRINARLHRGKVALSLDMSGESLHRRGYRLQQGLAPLKENLAAAILVRSGWEQMLEEARQESRVEQLALVDPMCGSGTILLEAALMAADIAPGLARSSFGFEHWKNHQGDSWQALREEATERRRKGLAAELPKIYGFDADSHVLRAANANAQRAKLSNWVQFRGQALAELGAPEESISHGLVLSNPPYGERLGELDELGALYRTLGDKLKLHYAQWQCGVFTGNPQLGKTMGIRAHKRYKLFNGTLASELLMIRVEEDQHVNAPPKALEIVAEPLADNLLLKRIKEDAISDGSRMVLNRIRKNLKALKKWAKAEAIDCYRVYDADIPEYSAAIDFYAGHWHVQEYQAPRSIEEEKAQHRLQEIIDALVAGFELDSEHLFVKQRRRQSGKSQYERQTPNSRSSSGKPKSAWDKKMAERAKIVVREGPARYGVNLWDYLDSGVFLDHRPVRKRVAELAKGKQLLNLFCYTGTVTVQAAVAGANSSVSVDMSRTYIQWCRENFALNNVNESRHELLQEDCFEFLKQSRQTFDVIVLDPPSFSNSKRMQQVLDVQRDHVSMISRCMSLLNPGGTLVFSNNLRSFKLATDELEAYDIENISADTIDKDFQRNKKIHQCWLIRQKG